MHRVLIIGCGRIAGGFDEGQRAGSWARTHAGAYRAHGGFAIEACVDPDAERCEAFAQNWGVSRTAATVADLPAGSYDVISICSPTGAHAEDIEAALALHPRLIFCEKPVSGSVEQTAALVERCGQQGVLLAVNYTRRWAPDVGALRAELETGIRGRVRSAFGTYTKGVVHNGGHMVDLLQMLLGPITILAVGQPVFDWWDDDPSVPALLQTGSGIPVTLNVGNARDCALFELVILTERGEIAMRDGGLAWTERQVGGSAAFAGYAALGPFAQRPGRYDEAMSAAIANIADALERGAPLASTGESALAAQRVCEQMRDAALAQQ